MDKLVIKQIKEHFLKYEPRKIKIYNIHSSIVNEILLPTEEDLVKDTIIKNIVQCLSESYLDIKIIEDIVRLFIMNESSVVNNSLTIPDIKIACPNPHLYELEELIFSTMKKFDIFVEKIDKHHYVIDVGLDSNVDIKIVEDYDWYPTTSINNSGFCENGIIETCIDIDNCIFKYDKKLIKTFEYRNILGINGMLLYDMYQDRTLVNKMSTVSKIIPIYRENIMKIIDKYEDLDS